MRIDEILYDFHPVGQGLFASGSLVQRSRECQAFTWVYDCGTVSDQSLIVKGIRRLEAGWITSGRLELVAISHFDKDHISGLAALLGRFRIGVLMLPYASLVDRLALAFTQRVSPTDPVFGYFADPIGYIRSLDGGEGVGVILIVPPSDGRSAGPEDDSPSTGGPGDPVDREGAFILTIDKREVNDSERGDFLLDAEDVRSMGVAMLKQGGRLCVDNIWEFMPYNDACRAPKQPAAFVRAVAVHRSALFAAATAVRRKQATEDAVLARLEDLKGFYDGHFGAGGYARNVISLFLYSGPLFAPEPHHYWISDNFRVPSNAILGNRIGQLFTGDGFLNSGRRIEKMIAYFTQQRLDRMGIFQVMHHGAKRNWRAGTAERLAPLVSVFSSDPTRASTFHPHAEVLRDFWPYGAVQVDADHGCHVYMRLY